MKRAPEPPLTADPRRAGTIAMVEGVAAPEGGRLARNRQLTLDLLHRSPAPFDRTRYDPGHITASAVVLSTDRTRVLLVLHDRLGVWLQPGGHVEPSDLDVMATAQREVREETGAVFATSSATRLVGVSVHEIPEARGEPRHLHHDLVFALVATSDKVRASPETRAVVWCPVERLGEYQVDDGLLETVERAVRAT